MVAIFVLDFEFDDEWNKFLIGVSNFLGDERLVDDEAEFGWLLWDGGGVNWLFWYNIGEPIGVCDPMCDPVEVVLNWLNGGISNDVPLFSEPV